MMPKSTHIAALVVCGIVILANVNASNPIADLKSVFVFPCLCVANQLCLSARSEPMNLCCAPAFKSNNHGEPHLVDSLHKIQFHSVRYIVAPVDGDFLFNSRGELSPQPEHGLCPLSSVCCMCVPPAEYNRVIYVHDKRKLHACCATSNVCTAYAEPDCISFASWKMMRHVLNCDSGKVPTQTHGIPLAARRQ